MAIYHLEAKVVSRGIGRSAVAASAYMSCSSMYNDYDGIQHNYTRKHGLVWEHIFLPDHAPPEWSDREVLWNAVEETEKTKDSRLAREFVIALPRELNAKQWQELLQPFISDHFVKDGMCADAAIHDPYPPGHNPHAHILLTVRPLDEKGKWQHKTEKEYLCIKAGEEKGFTASEYKIAQNDGWEKQYPYKVNGKKVYLPPSQAEGLERTSKYPKSTKYGRQNPITERWNSDDQLIKWREEWANIVNITMEKYGFAERIDHRSHADRGLLEQPTIHEGYAARKLEKTSGIATRCAFNRQIKTDNLLLRELQKQVEKLEKVVRRSIPALAEALERLRGQMILIQYQMFANRQTHAQLSDWLKEHLPIVKQYQAITQKIQNKLNKKKTLTAEKKKTGILNPIRHIQLNQQLTTITEDLEELQSAKHRLILDAYCHNEGEMKQMETSCKDVPKRLSKLSEQYDHLEARLKEVNVDYFEVKLDMPKLAPEQTSELLDKRIYCRESVLSELRSKLQKAYGASYDHHILKYAIKEVDELIPENSAIFKNREMKLHWQLEQTCRQAQQKKQRNNNKKRPPDLSR